MARGVLWGGPRCHVLIDLKQLDSTLDLWRCMWEPEEQEAFAHEAVEKPKPYFDDDPSPGSEEQAPS